MTDRTRPRRNWIGFLVPIGWLAGFLWQLPTFARNVDTDTSELVVVMLAFVFWPLTALNELARGLLHVAT